MSEAEVQALYDQLRKLRGQLPEFLQSLTNLEDAQTPQEAFMAVTRALSAWTAETRSFIGNYERLKGEVEREEQGPEVKAEPSVSSNDGGVDTFGNEFFDLT